MRSAVLAAFVVLLAVAPAADARVPVPRHYEVMNAACPESDPYYALAAGCSYPDGRVYVPGDMSDDGVRFTFWHELGHVFDFESLTPGDRHWFTRMLGERGNPWLREAGEAFADVYAVCALSLRREDDGAWPGGRDWHGTARRKRAVCRAIWRVAARSARDG